MTCARFASEQRKEPLCSTPMPGRPWKKLGVDLFEVEKMHFLVVVDYYYLRYSEVIQLTGTKSTDIVMALKSIFSQFGIPNVLVTDSGPQLVEL